MLESLDEYLKTYLTKNGFSVFFTQKFMKIHPILNPFPIHKSSKTYYANHQVYILNVA